MSVPNTTRNGNGTNGTSGNSGTNEAIRVMTSTSRLLYNVENRNILMNDVSLVIITIYLLANV